MKKKFYLSLLAGALTAAGMSAAPVSPDQALAIADRFSASAVRGKRMSAPPAKARMKLAHTQRAQKSQDALFYAFNRGENAGYVLVSADDRLPEVIGYSSTGNFDAASLPDNMKGMVRSWDAQIQWLLENPGSKALSPEKPAKAIAPLLGDIVWDQGDPYNRKCPSVTQYSQWGEPTGKKGPAATGCVATALGQIMYYHQWPQAPEGSVSYTSKGEDDTVNVNVVFDGHRYDWSKMLPKLTSSSPSDAIEEVSTLLFHVGAAFESIYGASTGATDVSIAPALKKYFGYDKGVSYLLRDFFSEEEWNRRLLDELENKRPVAYGGLTKKWEGHFFVLDGIDAEGYYHVNWGWSGMEDGYYLLTLLEPGSQGAGGASSGTPFHYGQNMIVGITKPGAEPSAEQICFTSDYLTAFDKTVARQGTAALEVNELWNNSATSCTANLGFVLVDSLGNVVHRQWVKKGVQYDVAHGESAMSCAFIIPDNIGPGRYAVRAAYQLSGDGYAADHFVIFPNGRADRYTAVVTDRNITYTTDGAFKLSMLDVTTDTDSIRSGVPTRFTVKVRNEGGEFFGPVQLRVFIKGKDRVFGTTDIPKKPVFVSIPARSESELEFETTLSVPGHDNYVFRLYGNEGKVDAEGSHQKAKNLCSKDGFKIIGPALPPVLYIDDDMIFTTAVNGVIPKNDVCVKAYIENEGGPWTGKMRMAVWDNDTYTRNPYGYIEFDEVSISGESTEWVNLTGGEFPDAAGIEIGRKYDLELVDPISNTALVPSYYNGGVYTLGEPVEKIPQLALEEIWFSPDTPVAGQQTTVQFSVANTGYAYNGPVSFIVRSGDQTMHTSEVRTASVPRGESALIDFTETFELPTASDYTVALLDAESKEIGSRTGISFVADEPKLALDSLSTNPATVESGSPAEFTFSVSNTGFRYNDRLSFAILLDGAEKFRSATSEADIARGKSADVVFNETVDLPSGDNYLLRLFDADGSAIGEKAGFAISPRSGVDSAFADNGVIVSRDAITAPGAIAIKVYAADGRLVASARSGYLRIAALQPGAYIVRVDFADAARTLRFIR